MPSRSTTLPSASRGNSRKAPSSSPEASLAGPGPEPGADAARVVHAGRAPPRGGRRETRGVRPRTAAADVREDAFATTRGDAETRDAGADASADMSRGLDRRERTRAFALVAVCRRPRPLPSAHPSRKLHRRDATTNRCPTDRNSNVRPAPNGLSSCEMTCHKMEGLTSCWLRSSKEDVRSDAHQEHTSDWRRRVGGRNPTRDRSTTSRFVFREDPSIGATSLAPRRLRSSRILSVGRCPSVPTRARSPWRASPASASRRTSASASTTSASTRSTR